MRNRKVHKMLSGNQVLKPYVDLVAMALHFGLGATQVAALDHQLLGGIHEFVLQLQVNVLQVF